MFRFAFIAALLLTFAGLLMPIYSPAQESAPPARWISLPCKFSDIATETPSTTAISAMFGAEFGGMQDYWYVVSHGKYAITHTTANWKTLPAALATYAGLPGAEAQKAAIFSDCAAAHDADVDFSQYDGINITVNGYLYTLGTGASYQTTLDGITRQWSVLWLMPELYQTATAGSKMIASIMGLAFGWPHSNNYDMDAQWADNPWDMMSKLPVNCIQSTSGCVAQFPTAYHLIEAGWINPTVYHGAPVSIDLDFLDMLPVNGVSAVKVPIDGTRYYLIEARRISGHAYDAGLPGTAVIIHEVDPARSEPAWLIGGTDNAASAGPQAMWMVGETFIDPVNNIPIHIASASSAGFQITVGTTPPNTSTPTLDPSITPTVTQTPTIDPSKTLTYVTPTPTLAPTLSGVSLLKNGTFEDYHEFTLLPDDWRLKNTTGEKVRCNTSKRTFAHSGACAFMFKGGLSENSRIIQQIAQPLQAGDNLTLSLYMKARNADHVLKIRLKVRYTNGTNDGFTLIASNNSGNFAQFFKEYQLTSTPERVQLQIIYRQPAGRVFIDDVELLHVD